MLELSKELLIYRIIALLLAVMLWFYVTADQNPPIEKTLTLNIEYDNLIDELILTEKESFVNIKIRAEQQLINGLGIKDFNARVDLSQVGIGENTIPVLISKPGEIEILEVFPKEININVDKISEKQVPVNIALLGQTAHGYSSFKASVKPSQVLIRGPENLLANIVEARADINLNNAQSNLVLSIPVEAHDKWGNWYGEESVNIIPDKVEVFVPITQDTPSRTVPVKPIVEGKPQEGYQISRVLVEPETVKVLGTFNKLDKIDSLQTEAISVAGINESVTKEVSLKIPKDLTLLYGEKVKVVIQVEKNTKERSLELPIHIENKPPEKNVELTVEKVIVKLEGKEDIISQLKEEDLKVFIDTAQLEEGEHELEVKIEALEELQVVEIKPAVIKATVVKNEEIKEQEPIEEVIEN